MAMRCILLFALAFLAHFRWAGVHLFHGQTPSGLTHFFDVPAAGVTPAAQLTQRIP